MLVRLVHAIDVHCDVPFDGIRCYSAFVIWRHASLGLVLLIGNANRTAVTRANCRSVGINKHVLKRGALRYGGDCFKSESMGLAALCAVLLGACAAARVESSSSLISSAEREVEVLADRLSAARRNLAAARSAGASCTTTAMQDSLPACGRAGTMSPTIDGATDRMFHVVFGSDVTSGGLCQATTTSPAALTALCLSTDGCAGFTVGTLGRAGSVLLRQADASVRSECAGMDLYVRGQAPAVDINAVTPRPRRQSFGAVAASGAPVPSVAIDSTTFQIAITAETEANALLEAAVARYRRIAFVGNPTRSDRSFGAALASTAGRCAELLVSVSNATQALELGTDESYELDVRAGRSELRARTAFGAMRGLETFSQLLLRDGSNASLYSADVTAIADAPEYAYRGFMVDTARHFLPVAALLALVDGMAYEKLNVLHWHAVDDQSLQLGRFF